MGNQRLQISLSGGIIYSGQINANNQPSGQGILTITKPEQFLHLKGTFENGVPIKGRVKYKDLQYTGDLKNAQFTGQAILKNNSGLQMIGTFELGQFKQGNIIQKNKYSCKGQFDKTRILSGVGQYIDQQNEEVIKGQFKNGNLTGKGSYKLNNKDEYIGEFLDGNYHGQGQYISYLNKIKSFQGNFTKSIPNLQGTIEFANGDKYVGEIKQGFLHGKGQYTFHDKTVYDGFFYYNMMNGDCQIKYRPNCEIECYRGQVKDGLYNGLGVIQYRNGLIYKGYFLQNLKNGPGILILGRKMFKCLYIMDRLIGKIQQVDSSQ